MGVFFGVFCCLVYASFFFLRRRSKIMRELILVYIYIRKQDQRSIMY